MTDKIVLTGIKPTGMPHLGNYIGALKPMIESSKTQKSIMFIADLHALNTIYDPKVIREHTYQAAAIMMALGIDLNNTLLFRQSDIEQIYQLNTILMNVTPKGLMNRAHSYKAAMDKNIANGTDVDAPSTSWCASSWVSTPLFMRCWTFRCSRSAPRMSPVPLPPSRCAWAIR